MAGGRGEMKVLVACEYSGIVRDAFTRLGHDAVSVDLLPSESEGRHIIGDVLDVIRSQKFDLMIAHPPCTDLAVSGAKWFAEKRADGRQQRALEFIRALLDAPIDRIALENPVSVISSYIRKPDQIIQPWMFGEDASKKTCIWLKGLPKLKHTKIIIKDRYANQTPSGQNNLGPSEDRWKERSKTYEGIAQAMAEQWGVENNAYQISLW
jgi:site-specific DNA-cytosine methylase